MPTQPYSDPRFNYYPSFGGGVPASSTPTAIPGSTSVGSVGAQPPYSWNPAYGGKPQVADPTLAAKLAAEANLKNLGSYEDLARKVNEANYIQLMEQVRKGFPGYDEAIARASSNINSELAGQIAPDVVSQLTQLGAERGVAIGAPGSPNTNAALLKAFYDTSSNQQRKGMADYSSFMGTIPKGPLMDVTTMFTSGKDVMDAQNLANWIAAAADPASKAAAELAAARSGLNTGRNQTAPGMGGGGSPSSTNDMLNKLLSYYTKGPSSPTGGGQQTPTGGGGTSFLGSYGGAYDPWNDVTMYDPYGAFGNSYGYGFTGDTGGSSDPYSDNWDPLGDWFWDDSGGTDYSNYTEGGPGRSYLPDNPNGDSYDYNFYDEPVGDPYPIFDDLIGG